MLSPRPTASLAVTAAIPMARLAKPQLLPRQPEQQKEGEEGEQWAEDLVQPTWMRMIRQTVAVLLVALGCLDAPNARRRLLQAPVQLVQQR